MKIRSWVAALSGLLVFLACASQVVAAPRDFQDGDDAASRVASGLSSRNQYGTASAVVTNTVYFEDFENGDGGWTAEDLSHGVIWNTTTYNGHGVWWVGENHTCWAGGGGYGNDWDQNLTKTFTLGAGPISLTLNHQYDTELGFDRCYVRVSNDGGSSFAFVRTFSGNSSGFVNDTVDLSAYANQTIQLELEFYSDGGWSDEDGRLDTNGGWRVNSAQVTGYPADDFETGGDGWVATEQAAYVAEAPINFRLEQDPPCDASLVNCPDYGHSWVAYDPVLMRVPQVTGYTGPWSPTLAGIVSPEIAVPTGVDQVFFDFDVFHDTEINNPPGTLDDLFYQWQFTLIYPDGCERESSGATSYFHREGGWHHYHIDISGLMSTGAVGFRVKLQVNDLTQRLPELGWTPTHDYQMGPYFDNLRISTVTTVDTVDVAGTVSGCNGGLAGVTVDLNHPDGSMYTTVTDASGAYSFTGLDATLDSADVAIVVPLGYTAQDPDPAQALVPLSADQTVDFTLACLDPQGEARSMGYWKHQANVYLNNRGSAQESQTDMETTFPSAIFNHFYENGLNAIRVEGVTYMDDGSGNDIPLDLETIHATLSVRGNAGMEAKAKQQYLALLLNLASGKLLTSSVISEDGGTASQALQQMAAAINDGDPSNDETAKDIGDAINNAQVVPAGMIDLGLTTIAYSRPVGRTVARTILLGANPNPFRSGTTIRFSLKEAGKARVSVYDITGRLVRSVLDGWTEAGAHEATWDGTDGVGKRVASGIYYVRMTAGKYAATKRAVLVK